MDDNDTKAKVRELFIKLGKGGEGLASKEAEETPKSVTFTKTALPILYSNLILIEDMKWVENSNYFLGANGFISKKITLSSLKHDPNANLSNCAFRIFPRTYNVNKYKVLDFINQRGSFIAQEVQDINFKFSAEIFNNLDIIQNKFGDPVRYGDIIMLMHDNTHMFIKYVNSTKSLTFSNHDGDATLFSVEPATEIMLNDNQILKSGQPIRLKVAGFNYASQNLYFGLSDPYTSSTKAENNDNIIENNENEEQMEENSDEINSEENIAARDEQSFDLNLKKYKEKPDLVVEENSAMNWRFVLYNPFTTNEDLISFGDFIQIMYCDKNRVLGAAIIDEKEVPKNEPKEKKPKVKQTKKDSFDLKENILVADDEEIIINDISDKDLTFNTEYKDVEFYLSTQNPYNKHSTEDVNSTWILENIYPFMKSQSFIRFYEDEKLDTYRMTFRIKHFKTNKILSLVEVTDERTLDRNKGIMKGKNDDNKRYQFALIDNIFDGVFGDSSTNPTISEKMSEKMNSTEYQFSLFGFKKTNKSKSVDSTKPSINDFLKLYHVKTKSYIKIETDESKKKNILNFDDMLKCYVTLIKYPDEKEVVRIERLHYNTQWKFKFVQNLYYLTYHIIQNLREALGEMVKENNDNIIINEDIRKARREYQEFKGEENFEVSNFMKLKFVLDKLFKFVMNKFINKYNDYCGFSNVVNNRQLLISHFGFTHLFLIKLIYFYWLHDNNLTRIKKVEEILRSKAKPGQEANNYLSSPQDKDKEKVLYQMFRYTESIFQFMVIYCKNNSHIKKQLYEYLYVFFYFINLSGPCIDVLIEIFKNEESNLNFLIRDCAENKKFKNSLELIFKEYFFENEKSKFELMEMNIISTSTNQNINNHNNRALTLFDLILEYIKISEYSYKPDYDMKQIESNRKACEGKVYSFNPREKYIDLLIALVHMENKANIQDNQLYLIKKIIKIFASNFILDPTLSGEDKNYPPCLINLIYELAKDTQINDENNANAETFKLLHEYIRNSPNFREDELTKNLCGAQENTKINPNSKEDELSKRISDSHFSCNSKMYAYIKENLRNSKEDPEKVSKFFEIQKQKFLSIFKDKNSPWHSWNINYLDNNQIELACSVIQFMKNMIQIDLLSPQKEKEFLNFLISFLRMKYIIFSQERISNMIQGDMIIKEKSILERITKTEHEKYISISETWHKIYQIFRRVLINTIEDKYYQDVKNKIENKNNNFDYLHSKGQGDAPKYQSDEMNDIAAKNMTSHDALVESEEKSVFKGKFNKDYKIKDFSNEPNFEIPEKNKGLIKRNNSFYDKINGENRNYENITREDLKKEKKILLIKNIVSIFRLLIRKNINCLKSNFINYYLNKTNNNGQFVFSEFVERCIPSLEDGNENINRLFRRYCEHKIENSFPNIGYINLNNFFESSKGEDFNFIQIIIISFANSDDIETQEILIGLLYKYFHQRKTLFRDIFRFNEYLLPDNRQKIRNLYSNRGQEIKIIFNQFFQNYEMNKNKYDEKEPEKIEFFLNSLIKDILIVYENIFNYWKAELTFKENINYDKKKIEYMIEKIRNIENFIEGRYTQEIFLENLSEISYFLYYIRNNSESQYISSIISILNEHGEIYIKMFFSLLDDLIDKGNNLAPFEKKRATFFINKNVISSGLKKASKETILSIKNKFFTNLILLILLSGIILPKDEKALNYLMNLLDDKKELLKNDSYTRYLILLLISDIQKIYFSLDYFFIFKQCNDFVQNEYFGTLENTSNYNSQYPICFSILYLDIIYNVLSFIIDKNKMINETYLDEHIADIFLLLLKKMNLIKGYNFCNKEAINDDKESKDKIKLLIKVIKIINLMSNVEQLNKVIMLKIDRNNSSNFNNELLSIYFNKGSKANSKDNHYIDSYYPKPHNLYQIFINNLHELYNDTGHKLTEERALRYAQNIFELYKYILYYITFIDPDYFTDPEAIEQKKKIKNFILYILYGYSCSTDKFETKDIDLSFMNEQPDEIKRLLEQITFSSFHLLLNQIAVVKYFDFCHKEINGIKIDQEEVKKNFNRIFKDFKEKTQNIENENEQGVLDNIENNFKLSTVINIKTTDNCSVNIYILSLIEEILLYSLKTDVSTSSKPKEIEKTEDGEYKEKIENEIKTERTENENMLNSKSCHSNNIGKEKEQNLFEHKELIDILDRIKKMIIQYENINPKSQIIKFQNMLIEHKKELYVFERKESTSLIYYLLSFLDGKTKTQTSIQNQNEIIFNHFIQKSVDFIDNTLNLTTELTSKRIKHITYLIYIIKKILSFYEKNEGDSTTLGFRKKTLREMQMIIEKTGLIKISLYFIKKHNNNEKLLPFFNGIFKMFCKMLKFGESNKVVATRGGSNGQKLFYNIFNIKQEFEQVFSFMTETINKKIQTIISNKFLIVRNKKKTLSFQNQLLLDEYGGEIDENILEFLQLLCENHYENLQSYLHKQKNFRRDYDLVTDTQHYLNILFNNFEPFLFNSLCRCFDLLIEMVQGPCFESQLLLINSKLLVTINDLLKYYLNLDVYELGEKYKKVETFKKNKVSDLANTYKEKGEEDDMQENSSFKKNFSKMTKKQISLLTYKATILLQALVDSRNKSDQLYGSMMNIINSETLEALFKKVYFEHLTLISETNEIDDYLIRLSDYNRANQIADEIEDEFDIKQEKTENILNPEEYLILETGFYAYFLWKYYQDYDSNSKINESKEENKKSKCDNVLKYLKKIFFISECLHFIYEFFYAILKTICLVIGMILHLATFGRVKKFNLIRSIFKRANYEDKYAVDFYKQSTASIEVLKDDKVYIIYFFKLPFCNRLNKFEKQQFLESMDRNNNQSKLMSIMRYADQVKYELETDYKIKEFAAKIPIFGVIVSNIEFWKDLSLLISICLNLLNFLASHYEQTATTLCIDDGVCLEIKKWNEIQTLGGLNENEYDSLIQSLSLFQCIIGCLIYAEYMARKSPSFYKLNKEQAEELNYTGNKKTFYIFHKTIYEICTSFSVIYYTGVVVFGFLGIYKSNFFFSYLLLEIVTRFKTLQNVLLAIKKPYKELILIFILWIILIYYFSIIGYVWFRESEFPRPDKDCNSLLKCVATIFHQNNRMDNGISGYLNKRNDKPSKNPFTWRFFYDEIANLMLKILIVNMISGIIIDNFAALRKLETKMINDMNFVCTICDLKKDKIIKVYKNYGKDYSSHIKCDHNIFKYIFYIIYLYKKEKTELNGMESYIYEYAFIKKDITWFPRKKLYIAKPEELEIDSDEEDDNDDSDD